MSNWKIYSDIKYYFCTNSIVEWYPIFTDSIFFDVIVESLTFCKNSKGLQVHAYVIMLNHMHLIISSTSQLSVSDLIRDFKRHTSVELSTLMEERNIQSALDVFSREAKLHGAKRNYKVWQDGFHPVSIYSESFFMQKLGYIHNNPVRKGYVLKPEHWFYSSAGNYAGCANNALEIDFLE